MNSTIVPCHDLLGTYYTPGRGQAKGTGPTQKQTSGPFPQPHKQAGVLGCELCKFSVVVFISLKFHQGPSHSRDLCGFTSTSGQSGPEFFLMLCTGFSEWHKTSLLSLSKPLFKRLLKSTTLHSEQVDMACLRPRFRLLFPAPLSCSAESTPPPSPLPYTHPHAHPRSSSPRPCTSPPLQATGSATHPQVSSFHCQNETAVIDFFWSPIQ